MLSPEVHEKAKGRSSLQGLFSARISPSEALFQTRIVTDPSISNQKRLNKTNSVGVILFLTIQQPSKIGIICLDYASIYHHWPYWPLKRQPRLAIFTPNFYLYMNYSSPKQKLLTIPVKHKNIPTKMDTFTRTMQTPFSLNLLNGKSATKTRYVHTHHFIGSDQHSTNTRAPHHYGKLFNWVTQNGWICLHHASALFTKPLEQQNGNQDMIWSHTFFL